MIEKSPLSTNRVRKICGSFAFLEHRFLRNGFWNSLNHHELLLYFFLVLVADRKGLSFYGYDKICSLLEISIEEYIAARNGLIDKDLLAFDGLLFQLLSLPEAPVVSHARPLSTSHDMSAKDPATISKLISDGLRGGAKEA